MISRNSDKEAKTKQRRGKRKGKKALYMYLKQVINDGNWSLIALRKSESQCRILDLLYPERERSRVFIYKLPPVIV